MSSPHGIYLNRQRYHSEGFAYYAVNQSALGLFAQDPCPYSRWWKVRSWWCGYMRARSKAIEKSWSELFSIANGIPSNAYMGVVR